PNPPSRASESTNRQSTQPETGRDAPSSRLIALHVRDRPNLARVLAERIAGILPRLRAFEILLAGYFCGTRTGSSSNKIVGRLSDDQLNRGSGNLPEHFTAVALMNY